METFFRNELAITPQEWFSSSIFIIDFEDVYDTSLMLLLLKLTVNWPGVNIVFIVNPLFLFLG